MSSKDIVYINERVGLVDENYPGAVKYVRAGSAEAVDSVVVEAVARAKDVIERMLFVSGRSIDDKRIRSLCLSDIESYARSIIIDSENKEGRICGRCACFDLWDGICVNHESDIYDDDDLNYGIYDRRACSLFELEPPSDLDLEDEK